MGRRDPMKAENTLLDHVSWMEEKGYAPGYTKGVMAAVKSWLEYNHIEVKRKIKIANLDVPVSIQDEKVPDKGAAKKDTGRGRPEVQGDNKHDGLCRGEAAGFGACRPQ